MKTDKIIATVMILTLMFSLTALSRTIQYENKMEESRKQTRAEVDNLKSRLSNLEVPAELKQLEVEKITNKTGIYTVTAYCRCKKCCGKTDKITASGVKAKEGMTIAADSSITFGTLVYIDGVGYREVQDRGGSITGNHIDLYFESHTDALEFGKQNLMVEFIR